MKLSEAILNGIGTSTHERHGYKDDQNGLCALGCAMVANKLEPTARSIAALTILYPDIDDKVIDPTNPNSLYRNTLWQTIVVLNGDEKWSREKIADWVKSL